MAKHREYIITLKNKSDLDEFYNDLEKPGKGNGRGRIPERSVKCAKRRPISRNTHYHLTNEEASTLREDDRVQGVELTRQELGTEFKGCYEETSDYWDKSSFVEDTYRNWGQLRCTLGEQITDWGDGDTESQSATIKVTSDGQHVDVVIMDQLLDPDHPEFALNYDGSGGSRVVQYNWFQHNPEVLGTEAGTYTYGAYGNHGTHVGGTVAGNRMGWARKANIYSIDMNTDSAFDFVTAFHNSKPINPITNRKNPTIINASFALGWTDTFIDTYITGMMYQGSYIAGPFTLEDLLSYGMNGMTSGYFVPTRSDALDTDVGEAQDAGVIVVGAAANADTIINVSGGVDFDNYAILTISEVNYGVPYHKGASPTSADNVICVGAVSADSYEARGYFSNSGPRVDIYAPGQAVLSSVITENSYPDDYIAEDPRDTYYHLVKYQGTSMASPQVCGVLACALEQYPFFNQLEAKEYITHYGKMSQMYDSGGTDYADYESLHGSDNRYLYYYKERPDEGMTYPKQNKGIRPTSGVCYPRPNLVTTKSGD